MKVGTLVDHDPDKNFQASKLKLNMHVRIAGL